MARVASAEYAHPVIWCLFYGSGIFGSLVLYGVLQERIMAFPYGDPPIMFEDAVGLVFCNRIVALAFLVVANSAIDGSFLPQAPVSKYTTVSVTNVLSSVCQYNALKHVSFPVQTLGKSLRELPVMVWSTCMGGASYNLKDWLAAVCLTAGVFVFVLTGPIGSETVDGQSTAGLFLLAMFVILDSFTSTYQEKLFREHRTTLFNQMIYINIGSALITATELVGTGRMTKILIFATYHLDFARDAFLLSMAAVLAQLFIYAQVKDFGALVLAATLNMRQMCSIVLSYAMFSHSITIHQVFGLVTVFGVLFHKSGVVKLFMRWEEDATRKETLAFSETHLDSAAPTSPQYGV